MTTSNRRASIPSALAVIGSFCIIHLFHWLLPNVFDPWNAQTIDQLFLLRSSLETLRPPYDSTVVHVDISDQTLRRLNNSYQTRADYARAMRNLREMGVDAQAWDFIFAAKTNLLDDSIFIHSTSQAHNVYFGLAFELFRSGQTPHKHAQNTEEKNFLERTRWDVQVEGNPGNFFQSTNAFITFLDLARTSKGLGFLNLSPDRDGFYRRVPLFIRFNGMMYPSFAFHVVCDYLNISPHNIIVVPGRSITLKNAHASQELPHDIVIPIDDHGNMVINYIGPWEVMKHCDFADILMASDDADEMEFWKEELRSKLVIVSQVTTGSADVGPVPTDNSIPKSAIHANILNTILTSQFLRELTDGEMLFVEAVLMMFVFLLSLRSSSLSVSLGILGTLMAYLTAGVLLFLYGNTIINVIRPSLMIIVALLSIVAYRYVNEEKEKAILRRTFESYFPPTVVRRIMENPNLITSAGQKKELTVLFSDIKGFTQYSATLQPDEIQKMLNEYFEAMIEIVFKYGGTVDKFIGDGLMLFFGDPEPQPDHALQGVRAAIAMQKKTRELKAEWEKIGKMPIQIRVGINTGVVVVGNMGSARRLSYTVLGSDVNLAQRLEANAPVGGILISQRTYEFVKDHIATRPLGQINVKGIDEPVTVYEVPVDHVLR